MQHGSINLSPQEIPSIRYVTFRMENKDDKTVLELLQVEQLSSSALVNFWFA